MGREVGQMEHLDVTQSEIDDIMAVFHERGIKLLYSVQEEVRIYSHFNEVEAILWARGVFDGEKAIDTVISLAEVVSTAL